MFETNEVRVCELLCQPGPSLFPYSMLSSPAATRNQTISRREIKGPFLCPLALVNMITVFDKCCRHHAKFAAVFGNTTKDTHLYKDKKYSCSIKTTSNILYVEKLFIYI